MKNKKIKIKICGIKYDIKKISELSVDFMGFIFYHKSPRYLENYSIPKLKKNILKVGVFLNDSKENILKIKEEKNLDFVQLHGDESPLFCKFLYEKNIKIIKSFNVNKKYFYEKEILDYVPFSSYFLFDNNGGSGKKFCWKILENYSHNIPFFLSGGIGINDVEKIKYFYYRKNMIGKMIGIDINSKFEFFPGKKNIKMIRDFIKDIKVL